MIHLQKLDEPEILKNNNEEWTAKYLALLKDDNTIPKNIEFKYREKEIKDKIINETKNKCAYCESKISHTHPGDIEHIKPKSKFPKEYCDWKNLTLSCSICNHNKLDYYSEDCPILNPYNDYPEDHIYAIGGFLKWKSGDDLGKDTIKLLDLNRSSLNERRSEKIQSLFEIIDLYNQESNPSRKAIIKNEILRESEEDKEYSFVVKEYIKADTDIFLEE